MVSLYTSPLPLKFGGREGGSRCWNDCICPSVLRGKKYQFFFFFFGGGNKNDRPQEGERMSVGVESGSFLSLAWQSVKGVRTGEMKLGVEREDMDTLSSECSRE